MRAFAITAVAGLATAAKVVTKLDVLDVEDAKKGTLAVSMWDEAATTTGKKNLYTEVVVTPAAAIKEADSVVSVCTKSSTAGKRTCIGARWYTESANTKNAAFFDAVATGNEPATLGYTSSSATAATTAKACSVVADWTAFASAKKPDTYKLKEDGVNSCSLVDGTFTTTNLTTKLAVTLDTATVDAAVKQL